MKSTIFKTVPIIENLTFVQNIDDFAQKICQNLPFSNILLLSTDTDFFDFGFKIYHHLIKNNLKVRCVILGANFACQLDDFFKAKTLFSDFRGVVIFNKQILCHLLNNQAQYPKIFYLQCSSDIYGIFNKHKGDALVEHYFNISQINKNIVLKNFSVRTLALIDYLFSIALTKKQIDQQFFNKAKKLIVSSVANLSDGEQDYFDVFNNLILVEKVFSLKEEVKYFSSNITCHLMQQNLYDLEINYLASEQIIKKYKAMLLNRFESQISFSERAKLVDFFSNFKESLSLKSIYNQLRQIKGKICDDDKKQIKSLIKVYDRLKSEIEKQSVFTKQENDKKEISKTNKLHLCVSVCGDTHLSINGMTAVRQTSFAM